MLKYLSCPSFIQYSPYLSYVMGTLSTSMIALHQYFHPHIYDFSSDHQ